MSAQTHPTSIRLDRDLKRRLRFQAEQGGRTLAQHIVHILRCATPHQLPSVDKQKETRK